MFGKLSSGLKRAGMGSHGLKYKLEVHIERLENLPSSVKKCRVVWSRSAKVQYTDTKDVRSGVATFKHTLTQVATMYRDKSGKFEEKEYEFKVQVPGKSSSDALITIGKAQLNMSKFCSDETSTDSPLLPITFKVGGTTTGYLKMTVTTVFLSDADDGLTEVSGMTGLTSEHGTVREQDLEGFAEEERAKSSSKKSKKSKEDADAGAAAPRSKSTRRALPPTVEEDDDLDAESTEPSPPPMAKPKSKKHVEILPEDAEADNPFAKKVSKAPVRKPPPPKKWDDDDDVSPISTDDEKPKKSTKPKEPDESFDDMKASLFSAKKPTTAASSSSSKAAGAAAPPPPAAAKAKAAPAPPPPPAEEDEDALRSDLFTTKKAPPPPKAAVATKPKKPAPVPAPDDADDAEEPSTSMPVTRAAPKAAPRARSGEAPAPDGKALVAAGKAGSQDLDELRKRVAELEGLLTDEQAAKGDLNKKVQKYVDKIADLEDQLAEADVAELFNQMRDMEAKYQSEIKDLMDKHMSEMDELEERHKAELEEMRAQLEEGGGGGGAARASELAEREASLDARTAKLEAQQAAATKAQAEAKARLAEAEAKLAEAHKMIDDSLVVATRHQQENKALQEEVSKLKQQLADMNNWDTREAVAAVAVGTSAAAATAGYASHVDEELEELREKVQELQAENARLQSMNEEAERAASSMLQGIHDLLQDLSYSKDQPDASSMTHLAASVDALCQSHRNQARELAAMHGRLQELQAVAGRVKPHELLARLQQVSAERDQLQERVQLAETQAVQLQTSATSAQQRLDALQVQLDSLLHERAALESLKRSTIQDLRRQNSELRTSLRSMRATASPTASPQPAEAHLGFDDESSPPWATVHTVGSAAVVSGFGDTTPKGEGNWQEFEDLVKELRSDRESLREQVNELVPQLAKQRQLLQKSEQELIAMQEQAAAATAVATAATARAVEAASQELQQRVQELEGDKEHLKSQLAEMQNAESVIKEWSDYADTLTADKHRLEQQVEGLNSRLAALVLELEAAKAAESAAADGLVADKRRLEQQVQGLTGRLAALELELEAAKAAGMAAADGLLADKRRLEQQVEGLNGRLVALELELEAAKATEAASAEGLAADKRRLEQQVEGLSTRLAALELELDAAKAGEAAATAAASARAQLLEDEAEATPQEVEALRQEIHRLEASVSGLRQELTEAHSHATATEDTASSVQQPWTRRAYGVGATTAAADAAAGQSALYDDADSLQSADESRPTPQYWDDRVEHLLAQNAALEGQLADLQRSLEVALQPLKSSSGDELAQLHVQLAQALEAKAVLEATVALLEADLAQAPLLQRSASHRVADVVAVPAAALDDSDAEDSAPVLPYPPSTAGAVHANSLTPMPPRTASMGSSAAHGGHDAHSSGSSTRLRQLSGAGTHSRSQLVSAGEQLELNGLQGELTHARQEVLQLQQDRSVLTATVAGLRTEVSRLQEEKGDAHAAVERLSAEMQELAEALDAAGQENERLSGEVFTLRDQVEQLEEAAAAGASASHVSASQLAVSTLERQPSASNASVLALERRLAAVRAVTQELLRVLQGDDELDSDGDDLQQALYTVKDQVLRLQRQVHQAAASGDTHQQQQRTLFLDGHSGASTPRTTDSLPPELQLSRALARIEHLESQLEDAEIEHQHLTEQLEEYLTGGAAHSAGSVAAESHSPYHGSADNATSTSANHYSYGHDASLALSALEQRLSLAEARRDELSAELEGVARSNKAMAAELRQLREDLEVAQSSKAQLEADTAAAVQRFATVCEVDPKSILGAELAAKVSGRGKRASRNMSGSDEDPSDRKAIREKAQLQRELDMARKSAADLEAANAKLEGICGDLEEKATAQQDRADGLESDLLAAKAMVSELELRVQEVEALNTRLEEAASARGAAGAAAVGAAAGGVAATAALNSKIRDLEAKCARLGRELEEEQQMREELEEAAKDKLERDGDDEAADMIQAFENKYNRLKERYKVLEESSQEEIDDLQDQLNEAQAKVAELQRQVKQLQPNQSSAAGVGRGAAGSGASSKELQELQRENEALVAQLVAKTMQLAELSESEIWLRRELARAKEVNMKLAQKMTTLEAQAYSNPKGKK